MVVSGRGWRMGGLGAQSAGNLPRASASSGRIISTRLIPALPPRIFFCGVIGFVREDPFLGAAGARAFLAAKLFDLRAFGFYPGALTGFKLVEQQLARDESIESLLTGALTFYLDAGGPVPEHHAGGGFIDVLTAMSPGANERFLEVRLPDVQRRHALGELAFLLEADRK